MNLNLPWHWRLYFGLRRAWVRARRVWRTVFPQFPRFRCPFCGCRAFRIHPGYGFYKCFRCHRAGETKHLPSGTL